jgi:hypothetical protein
MEDFILLNKLNYNIGLAEALKCSDDDKKSCVDILDFILEMSVQARKHGLLHLQKYIEMSKLYLLRKAISYVIDGIEPNVIYKILSTYVLAENCKGKDLLENILVIDGLLSIQAGVNPLILREMLSAYFGIGFQDFLNSHFNTGDDSSIIEMYVTTCESKEALSPETMIIEELICKKVDDRSLQRLLREIDVTDLVLAMFGASGKVQKHIIRSVSKNTAGILVNELKGMSDIELKYIISSQKKVNEIALLLKRDGEIFIKD